MISRPFLPCSGELSPCWFSQVPFFESSISLDPIFDFVHGVNMTAERERREKCLGSTHSPGGGVTRESPHE